MKVSVIIPVYNVERYLARCLDSVVAATERLVADGHSAEIICVNDGSTDGCAEILERYRSASRLQPSTFSVLTKENGGLGSARNAGLDVMTGDYVTFVDSDDWIPAWALSRFASVADASKAALVVSMAFAKDVAPPIPTRQDWAMRPAQAIAGKKVQYSACNKLYRRDLFAARRYPETVFEDFPVTTLIFCDVGKFAAFDDALYVYCPNAGASSLVRSAFTERKMRDSLTVVRMVLDHAATLSDRRLVSFAQRQAADGLSSTVGQVYKSRDREIAGKFLDGLGRLFADYPFMRRALTCKAAFRLWRLRRESV